MPLIEDEELQKVIQAQIAQQILAALDTSHRDALLQASLVKVIGDYSFRSAVEKVAAEKASEVARRMLESEDWTKRVEEALRAGFEDYLKNLRIAMSRSLKELVHGTDSRGGYNYGGKILADWGKP